MIRETKQRFGFRKSKAIKGLGVALLGTYMLMSVGGEVKADEITNTSGVTESVVTEAPVTETPVATAPVTETPVTEAPVAVAPVTETPEEPVTETPVTETPVTEASGVEASGVEASGVEAPVTETPVTETPVTETPGVEAYGIEAPVAARVAAYVAPAETTKVAHFEDPNVTPTITESPTVVQSSGVTNYDLVATKTQNVNGIVVSGDTPTTSLVITTTDPAKLSADSTLKVTLIPDKVYDALNIQSATITDGRSSYTLVKDKLSNSYVATIPIGEVSEGTIKAVNTSFKPTMVSHGTVFNLKYELIDNGQTLRTITDKFTVKADVVEFETKKYATSEFLTVYSEDGSVVSTRPLPITTSAKANQHNMSFDAGLLQRITYTVPTGFVITDKAKQAGWVQSGNKVVKTYYHNQMTDEQKASPFVVENNATSAIQTANRTDVYSSQLEFDTSAFGTREELIKGKAYNIDVRVDTIDENGFQQTWNTTSSGTLRTRESSDAEGRVEISSVASIGINQVGTTVRDNVYAPGVIGFRDYVGMVSTDFANNATATIPEMRIEFNKQNVLGPYSVYLDNISISNKNASIVDPIFFNITDLQGNTLGRVQSNSYKRFDFPDNVEGIIVRPDGNLDSFGLDTLQGFTVYTTVTPHNNETLYNQWLTNGNTPITHIHRLTSDNGLNSIFVEDNVIYDVVPITISTNGSSSPMTPIPSTDKTKRFSIISFSIKNRIGSRQVLSTADYSNLVGEENNFVHITVPEELVIYDKNNKSYTNGTYKIPISDITPSGYSSSGLRNLDYKVTPSRTDVPDGKYEISWYFDWSGSSQEAIDMITGINPITNNIETASASNSVIIRNGLMLGSQTLVSSNTGAFTTSKNDVVSNTDFKLKANLINTLGMAVTGAQALQYLPREGFLNSTYDVVLTGPVTPANNWKVLYTTDAVTGNFDNDANLTFTETVADYTKVTAVKYVLDGTLDNNSYIPFVLDVKTEDTLTPDDVAFSQTGIITTQYPTYLISNPVRMTPRVYTEDWKTVGDVTLKDQDRLIELPPSTPDETFPTYTYVRSERDDAGNITHYYDRLTSTGDVVVKYVNTKGETIKDDVIDMDDADAGTDYTTVDNRPETIDFQGFTYRYQGVQSGEETGQVVTGEKVVTYVYEIVPKVSVTEDKGSVVVKYVDENGREIKSSVNPVSDVVTTTHTTTTTPDGSTTVDTPSGATYDVTNAKVNEITFENFDYTLVRTDGVEAQVLPTGETVVTHVYKVVPKVDVTEDKGSVVVRYVDENGREIASSVMPVFDVITATHTTTTTPDGSETVHTPSGATYDVTNAKVNEITFENFDYTFVRTDGGDAGVLPTGETVVTHVYKVVPKVDVTEDKGSVVVKYVDENGREIKQSVNPVSDVVTATHTTTTTPDGSTTVDTLSGATYDVTSEKVDEITFENFDYTLVRTDGVEAQVLPTGETVVTHVYKVVPKVSVVEDKGSVVVKYVDENGREIKPNVNPVSDVITTTHTTTTTPEGSTTVDTPSGATYDVTGEKVDEITFENFDYTFVRTDGVEAQVLPTGETVVTHVYNVVPKVSVVEDKGSVVVKYVDENGREIKSSVNPVSDVVTTTHTTTTTPDGSTTVDTPSGATYDVTGEKVDRIEFDGSEYVLLRTDGVESQVLPTGETVVTHVYHKVVTEIPNEAPIHEITEMTITRWITEDGDELTPVEDGTQESREFDGYTFEGTEVDGPITTHIYHKVVTEIPNEAPTHEIPEMTITRWITEDGEELTPVEDGTQESREFDGYTFEGTEVDGPITTHIYHKVVTEIPNESPTHEVPELTITRWITEDGDELTPVEDGTQESREFDGYTFEGTEVDGPITTHVYHKVVTEIPNEAPTHEVPELTITRWITEDGEELTPVEDGTQGPREFDGYTFEGTGVDGPITTHVYHKVVTEIPNEAPTHEIPEMTITRWITEDGNELTPIEDGTQEPKEFDGYTFERTEVDGPITTHVYHKVVTEIPNEAPTHSVPEMKITRWITENGEELTPVEDGTQEPREFDGYTFESTEVDGPITTHVYHKVVTEIPNETPEEPVTETPEEPVTETPEEPVTETPEEPVTETPEEPVTETPEEPVTETPKVETQAVETPVTSKVEAPKADELPDTGDSTNILSLLGMIIIGMVGAAKRRKKP